MIMSRNGLTFEQICYKSLLLLFKVYQLKIDYVHAKYARTYSAFLLVRVGRALVVR